ncbi:MAG: VUT family protein [Firmicutes bacterium]|nr:VUT family protein [Bacillota bacterium]
MNLIKREMADYRVLLRNVPSLVVMLFVVSVIMMNLLANKELFSVKYLALDCGFTLSWISFLCMDMICKRFGPKAAAKISILALATNLFFCLILKLLSLTPGNWGEFYSTGLPEVNSALNTTFGGCWYVVVGSSTAMLVSAICNSALNHAIAKRLTISGFKAFAIRSYVSTGIAQFVDNLIFALIVSHTFFGWTWVQVLLCSVTGAVMELLCEVIFSPIGYKVSQDWEKEKVGNQYLEYASKNSVTA